VEVVASEVAKNWEPLRHPLFPQPINYEHLAGQSFARFFRVFPFITLPFITNRLSFECLPCVQLLVCTYRVWPPCEGGVGAANFRTAAVAKTNCGQVEQP
jgi:hypothetical protein